MTRITINQINKTPIDFLILSEYKILLNFDVQQYINCLTFSSEFEAVLAQPGGSSGASLGLGESSSLAQSSGRFSGFGQTSEFSVFHDGLGDPVDLGVASDSLMERIDHNHFVVLISGILADPVRVKDSQSFQSSPHAFFRDRLKVSFRLLLFHGTGSLGFTVRTSLGHGAFSSSSSHGDAVNHESYKQTKQ